MATQTKSKLEVLWQDFEKSGSIEAYLNYQQIKLANAKSPKKVSSQKVEAKAKR
jgi:hypothetical protein